MPGDCECAASAKVTPSPRLRKAQTPLSRREKGTSKFNSIALANVPSPSGRGVAELCEAGVRVKQNARNRYFIKISAISNASAVASRVIDLPSSSVKFSKGNGTMS